MVRLLTKQRRADAVGRQLQWRAQLPQRRLCTQLLGRARGSGMTAMLPKDGGEARRVEARGTRETVARAQLFGAKVRCGESQ